MIQFVSSFLSSLRHNIILTPNADLAGTWVLVGFGDGNNGNSIHSQLDMWKCDSGGNCNISIRRQKDGVMEFESFYFQNFSVASDGSFGESLDVEPNTPSYAAAIGSNGNVLILNRSFELPILRRMLVGARCSSCSNITELTGISGKWLLYRTPQDGMELGPGCVYITQMGNHFIINGYSYSEDFHGGGSINNDQIQFNFSVRECDDKFANGTITGVLNGNIMSGIYTNPHYS